ncbi:MAG TPA: prolyl-tRNA synthetase associated domain-containing protein [Gemmatimonadaceae bacterium]
MSTDIYVVLASLDIHYTKTEHAAAFTVEQADHLYGHLPGAHSKNLFLRNKKGDVHYLVVVRSDKRVDLKSLRNLVDEATLSFASPERLLAHLGVTPGSVTPLGLIHDAAHAVRVILDKDLMASEHVNFHPLVNTATLTLLRADFERFLQHCGNPVRVVEIPR